MPISEQTQQMQRTMATLLKELLQGADPKGSFILNPGDAGLLASLDKLTAAEASAPPSGGGASIAAHVDHLHYGFTLMNRWSKGENPFGGTDFAASWQRGTVDDEGWRALRARLAAEANAWLAAIAQPREWEDVALNGAMGSVAHLAYHIGAIRQIDAKAKGPSAND